MRALLENKDSLERLVGQEPQDLWGDLVKWAHKEQKEKREMRGPQANQDFQDLRGYLMWRAMA